MKNTHFVFFFIFTLLFTACASPNPPIPAATETLPPVAQEVTATNPPIIEQENAIHLVSVDPPVENGLSASDPITITFSYYLSEDMGMLQVWFDSFQDDQCTYSNPVPTDPKGGSTMPGGLMQPLNGGSQTLSLFIPPIPPIGVQYIGVGVRLWNTEETTNLAEDVDYAYCYEAQTPTVALVPVVPAASISSAGSTVTDTPEPPAAPGATTGGISGIVYADENSNGMQDSGETGVATFGLTISDSTCMTLIAGATPDSNGHYSLTGLAAGRYCVILNYSLGTPVVPNVHQVVDVSAGASSATYFGIQPAVTTTPPPAPPPAPTTPTGHSSISVTVYRLISCESTERIPLPDITVNLIQAGILVSSATTASNGNVSFYLLPAGDYITEFTGLTNCLGHTQFSFHLLDFQGDSVSFEDAP